MSDQGDKPHLIFIQRQAAGSDDGYTTSAGAWAEHARAWARLRYGSGAERREAAQERSAQTATFECDWSPELEAVRMSDRIVCFDTAWDISSKAITGNRREVHLTAVANLEAVVEEPPS